MDMLRQKGVHASGVLHRDDIVRKLEQLRLPQLDERPDPGTYVMRALLTAQP